MPLSLPAPKNTKKMCRTAAPYHSCMHGFCDDYIRCSANFSAKLVNRTKIDLGSACIWFICTYFTVRSLMESNMYSSYFPLNNLINSHFHPKKNKGKPHHLPLCCIFINSYTVYIPSTILH